MKILTPCHLLQSSKQAFSLHHLLGHESTASYSGIAPLRKKKFWTVQHINQHREFSLHHGSELLLQGGHYILGKKKNVVRNYGQENKNTAVELHNTMRRAI